MDRHGKRTGDGSESFFGKLLPELVEAGAIDRPKAERLRPLEDSAVEQAISTKELMKLAIHVSPRARAQSPPPQRHADFRSGR